MADSLTEPLIEESCSRKPTTDEHGGFKDVDERAPWILTEIHKQFWLAGPIICVNVLQYSLNLVSVMFVGHLGELALASSAVATSISGVTGFSVLVGLSSALETLCGQAYGAKQYHMLGIYLQRAILLLYVASIPVSCIWLNVGPLLRLMGQDPEISDYAGLYCKFMLPTLFAYATVQPLVKFLQTQSAVLPMALCSALTLVVHIPMCWLIVYKLGVGYRGAAIANSLSQWLNVILLVIYIKFGPTCKKTWTGFSTEAFHDVKGFFKLAIPSMLMICLEYWSFELMVILSGLLPNPKLEMSALSLSLNTIALMYMIPMGFGASVSTRVSNELGAGKAVAAKRAVALGCALGFCAGLIICCSLFSARNTWPHAFTNEPEVVEYVSAMIPYLSVITIMDSSQGVLCGVMRGCGNQIYGAYTNLGAYYVVGVPIAVILAFHFHLNGRKGYDSAWSASVCTSQELVSTALANTVEGLWLGMTAALTVQALSLLTISIYTDWEKQAQRAVERVYVDRLPIDKTILDQDDSKSALIQHDGLHN